MGTRFYVTDWFEQNKNILNKPNFGYKKFLRVSSLVNISMEKQHKVVLLVCYKPTAMHEKPKNCLMYRYVLNGGCAPPELCARSSIWLISCNPCFWPFHVHRYALTFTDSSWRLFLPVYFTWSWSQWPCWHPRFFYIAVSRVLWLSQPPILRWDGSEISVLCTTESNMRLWPVRTNHMVGSWRVLPQLWRKFHQPAIGQWIFP